MKEGREYVRGDDRSSWRVAVWVNELSPGVDNASKTGCNWAPRTWLPHCTISGMTRLIRTHRSTSHALLIAVLLSVPATVQGQTPIERHRNNYTPQQDVQLGREAANEVRRQLPLLDDERTEAFVERIGERLVGEIPADFHQPEFRYTFELVNLREINAFALPGGPMFLHRGMIEAARGEGEVAGVMAHELAHVILRHGTAQATRGQRAQLGAIAGQVLGSILGGRTGAIISSGTELAAGGFLLKYSREFEREADLFGAQLMARAGYDPRDMATMFETIQRQGGRGGPEWLSSHPNPANRAQAITREAELMGANRRQVSNAEFQSVQARLNELPPAPTSEQVARARERGYERSSGGSGASRRAIRVEPPSDRWRTHQAGDLLRLRVPENWEPVEGSGTVAYAPEGGYFRGQGGQQTFTHGLEIGTVEAGRGTLQQQTERLLQGFAQSNPQLRRQSGYARTSIGGRQGLTTTLANVSEATGEREMVNVSTVALGDGRLLFLIGVAPSAEAREYQSVFSRVRQSLQIADR